MSSAMDPKKAAQLVVLLQPAVAAQPIHQERQVLLSMGGGHSDDQLPLPTTQPDVCRGGGCIYKPTGA